MARIRTVKPDYWKSEKLAARLPGPDGREARRMFIGLWNIAEDHGVLRGNPSYIRAELYPYDEDVTTADVARWLDLLEAGGFVVRYSRDDSSYLFIPGFPKHQQINKPSRPTLPGPTEVETKISDASSNPPVVLPESSGKRANGKGSGSGSGMGSGNGGGVPPAAPPPEETPATSAEPPTAPTLAPSEGHAFFAWAQAERETTLKAQPQELTNRRDQEAWDKAYLAAKAAAAAAKLDLQDVWLQFLCDEWAQQRAPACPWQAFASRPVLERCISRVLDLQPPSPPAPPCAKCRERASETEVWGFRVCYPCLADWERAVPDTETETQAATVAWIQAGRAA